MNFRVNALFFMALINALLFVLHTFKEKKEFVFESEGKEKGEWKFLSVFERERVRIESEWTEKEKESYSSSKCLSFDPNNDQFAYSRRSCVVENVCVGSV